MIPFLFLLFRHREANLHLYFFFLVSFYITRTKERELLNKLKVRKFKIALRSIVSISVHK